jgi:hypothetical protein
MCDIFLLFSPAQRLNIIFPFLAEILCLGRPTLSEAGDVPSPLEGGEAMRRLTAVAATSAISQIVRIAV